MKKQILIVLLAVGCLAAYAQKKDEMEPFLVKSLKGQSFTLAKIRTSGGSITVVGSDDNNPRIEVYVQANNNEKLTHEEIQQRLDEKYKLDINVSDNKLVAVAERKEKLTNWKKSLSIGFKVFVPQKMATDLSTSGGSISLSDVNGEQDFTTSGGSLVLDKVSGNVKGRTSGGNIQLKNCRQNIDLATSGGSISAKNCEGNLILNTSGGSIYFKHLKGEIKTRTSGGNVEGDDISGELHASTSGGNVSLTKLACSIEASTSGGNVRVEVIELGKFVTLSNSGGRIELSLPKGKGLDLNLEANRVSTGKLENFSGSMKPDEVEGKLNGGGVPVKVKSSSGQIVLAFI